MKLKRCMLCFAAAALLQASAQAAPPPALEVVYDLTTQYGMAQITGSVNHAARSRETSDDVPMPGIFLHPSEQGDAELRFPPLAMPEVGEGERLMLLVWLGLRDYIDFEQEGPTKPNGVRFGVDANGETILDRVHARPGWEGFALPLHAGDEGMAEIVFRTNAIDGKPHFDWAVFGRPLVVVMRPQPYDELEPERDGLALVRLSGAAPASLRLSIGDAETSVRMPRQAPWVPLLHGGPDYVHLEQLEGAARIEEVLFAPLSPEVMLKQTELSTPLVRAGKPVRFVQTWANEGLGELFAESTPAELAITQAASGEPIAEPATGFVPPLAGREDGRLVFPAVRLDAHVGQELSVKGGPSFPVFPPEPATSKAPLKGPAAVAVDGPIRGVVGNARSRISVVLDEEGRGYGIAETWNGRRWQRVGALYPLAQLALTQAGSGQVRFNKVEAQGDELLLHGVGEAGAGLRLRFQAAPDAARIRIEAEANVAPGGELYLFSGPELLAGDGAYGARKAFAVFPGLEYLEGDEPSSSERDLLFPLSERRAPVWYKITAPIMAVQAEDSLSGIIWDMRQHWARDEAHPAARFNAPALADGLDYTHMGVFAPSVGDYVDEHSFRARRPYRVAEAGETLKLGVWMVLDHLHNQPPDSVARGPHGGGLLLEVYRHYFDIVGVPEPSPEPRSWEAQKDLSMDAYFNAVWNEDPPGWNHVHGREGGLYVGHAVPQLLVERDGAGEALAEAIGSRVDKVLYRALREAGADSLYRKDGCHILHGELPYYYGYLAANMRAMRDAGQGYLDRMQDGKWRWRPKPEKKYEALGRAGDQTLSQPAMRLARILRAARLSGDFTLADRGLAEMHQMHGHEVPRGAQTWECPLYQPDILAAAQAIRAYTEAYRLTGDAAYLDRARYWAWTGLPFLYLWEQPGYPTMRYNTIAVFGSTFYSHSWIGMPVVWCGLVYAYALQEFAQYDDSLPWTTLARGITHSAMWQQYEGGPNKGTYPDSWDMAENRPNPVDINPENILVNAFRLRTGKPAIQFQKLESPHGPVALNTAGQVRVLDGRPSEGVLRLEVNGDLGYPLFLYLAPAPSPSGVSHEIELERVSKERLLQSREEGYYWSTGIGALVVKLTPRREDMTLEIAW